MASETVAGAALDSDPCGIIRRLPMLLIGWGTLSAEKKSHWRGHWTVCVGLPWKPCAGYKIGKVPMNCLIS